MDRPRDPLSTAPRDRWRTTLAVASVLVVLGASTACRDLTGARPDCFIPLDEFHDAGVERSGIPWLTNPRLATRGTPEIAYLSLSDRVIGLVFNGQPVAIPHKFLWHHEIVNMEVPGEAIIVTYSPLTGSSAVFERPAGAGPVGISGYVLHSNLVLEEENGTIRPQMSNIGSCGPSDGSSLVRVAFEEVTLGAWTVQHPDTWIASSATGYDDILYTLFPYGLDYVDPDNSRLVYPVEGGIDPRQPPKELVFGIASESGTDGLAFSLELLDQLRGAANVFVSVANAELDDRPIAVFWNAFARSANAYRSDVDGQTLHFVLSGGDRRDVETGTAWDFTGFGYDGPLAGTRLEPIEDVLISYWFAWAAFHPSTDVWEPPVPASLLPVSRIGVPDAPMTARSVTR